MKRCFVIMPFSSTDTCLENEWTEIFEHVIKPAVEESGSGYECVRSNVVTGAIIDNIIKELYTSDIVIADLTDRNPNVFYELGVRHSLKRGTILISQDYKHVPSDIRHYGVIVYGTSPGEVKRFREEIKDHIKQIEEELLSVDNPISNYLKRENIELVRSEELQNKIEENTRIGINSIREQFELVFSQFSDQLNVDLSPNNELDLSGHYSGNSWHLEIFHEDLLISGDYYYGDGSDEGINGMFEGVINDNVIPFNWRNNNPEGPQSGCGFFKIRSHGLHLDGYYSYLEDYKNYSLSEIIAEGTEWRFTRL